MIDKLLVPPDTAGWMVRVPTDEFYLVAIADEAEAVKPRARATALFRVKSSKGSAFCPHRQCARTDCNLGRSNQPVMRSHRHRVSGKARSNGATW